MAKPKCVKYIGESGEETKCYASVDRASAPFVSWYLGIAIAVMIAADQLFF